MVENIVVHLKTQDEWDELLTFWNPFNRNSEDYMGVPKYDSLYIQGSRWSIGAIAYLDFFKNHNCKIVTLEEAYKILGINPQKTYELW